jgi:hypothetical protein
VRFLVDGRQIGARRSAPWRWRWDARRAAAGPHGVSALVEDAAGVAASSATVTIGR